MRASKRKETLAAYTFPRARFSHLRARRPVPDRACVPDQPLPLVIVPARPASTSGSATTGTRSTIRSSGVRSRTPASTWRSPCPRRSCSAWRSPLLLDARMPARGLFRTLYYLPVVTSWVVVSLLFRYMFITDGGLINFVLHDKLHVVGHNVEWLRIAGRARGDQHPRHLERDRLVDGDLPRRAPERAARAEGGRRRRRREGLARGSAPSRCRRSCR